MYGAAIGAAITFDGDAQYIDSMAVTKCAYRRPTHECSDADICHKVCDHVPHKRGAVEWITSHRLETEARNAQVCEQIRHNGEVDLLAKMAMRLPVPDYDPNILKMLRYAVGPPPLRRENGSFSGGVWPLSIVCTGYPGCRCAGTDACFGLNGSRPGTMGWYGRAMGPYHSQMSPLSPPSRYHCPQMRHTRMRWKVAFRNMWLSTRGPWQDTVPKWWNRALAADLHHVSCLRILWDHIPRALQVDLRERVAWHQYHALHGVCQLLGQLTMPPRDPQVPPMPSTAVPAWYTKLRPQAVRPNPTDSVLRNQVGYTGPRERTSRRDGRASQEASHCRAVRTWDRPQPYQVVAGEISRPVPLSHCLRPGHRVASAMQYLARPLTLILQFLFLKWNLFLGFII